MKNFLLSLLFALGCCLPAWSQTTFTGTLTQGSDTVTAVSSVSGLAIGTQVITCVGCPPDATLTNIGTNTVALSAPATASATVTLTAQASQSGFTLLFGQYLYGTNGLPLSSGTIRFTPLTSNGAPIGFSIGGSNSGQSIVYPPFSFPVTNGVISSNPGVYIPGTTTLLFPQLPDTSLTSPKNICYSVTVVNTAGRNILGPGYACIQPSGPVWDFDTFSPNQPANVSVLSSYITSVTALGTAGPATVVNGILNIPQYAATTSVQSFSVGSWPSWLTPTVTNPTSTVSLAVVASAIPNTALANSSTIVNGQICTLGGTCTIVGMVYPTGSGIPVVVSGTSWGTTVAAPTGTIVGTIDTQTLTNKTVDGVSPTVFGYVDATSSIQTQLNGKQATGSYLTSISIATANSFSGTSSGGTTPALTITCSTCVVASSPGVGVAHFAGSTQTVTSSAVSLTADVSGVLPQANGGFVSNTPTVTWTSLGTTTYATAGANVSTATVSSPGSSTTTSLDMTGGIVGGYYDLYITSAGFSQTFNLTTSATAGHCSSWHKPGGGGAITSLTLTSTSGNSDELAWHVTTGYLCILTQGTNY